MANQIEVISDQLGKAIRDNLFNDIWYYIKDFKNYKIQFILEDLHSDDPIEYTIVGEINQDGFKDMFGNYFLLCDTKESSNHYDSKFIPPKYRITYHEEEPLEFLGDFSSIIKFSNLGKLADISLSGYRFHEKESAYSVSLPIDFLHKLEEAITLLIFSNESLRKFLINLRESLYNEDQHLDYYFNFVSLVTDPSNNTLLNVFLGLDTDEVDSTIRPINYNVIVEAQRILGYSQFVSYDLPELPSTLLDDLREIEKKDNIELDRGIVFREYHRLIERFANFIYDKLFDKIQSACELINDEEARKNFSINEMVKKKENYQITSLNKFSSLLRFLSARQVNILHIAYKKDIKEKYIPIVDTYSGFSKLRNIQTHDRIPVDASVLNSGIAALKSVIKNLYVLILEVSKK